MANERPNVVKMKGNPVTLLGNEVKVGDKAPDFTALAGLGAPVGLGDLKGKVKVFNVVVSVDTPVCDIQTKRFNKEAAGLGDGVEIVTLSMDLPFALKRYCAAEGIDRVKTLSDYQNASFGEAYGVLIKGKQAPGEVGFCRGQEQQGETRGNRRGNNSRAKLRSCAESRKRIPLNFRWCEIIIVRP